mgnify:CR=1 FL=1
MDNLTIILVINNNKSIINLLNEINNYNIIIIDNNTNINLNTNIKIIRLPETRTLYHCINIGIKACNTKYITYIDQYDIIYKDRFKKQLKLMNKNNYLVSLCLTKIYNINYISLKSLIINKEIFNNIGYFKDVKLGSEIDFIFKFMLYYEEHLNITNKFLYNNDKIQFNNLGILNEALYFNNKYDPLDNSNIFLFNNLLKSYNTFPCSQLYLSESLKHLSRIYKKYNLQPNNNINKPALFFGLYTINDINNLKNHKGDKYVIWGGTDCNIKFPNRRKNLELIVKIKIKRHYAISRDIYKRLKNLGINSILFNFNIVDKNIFKKIDVTGDSIYIYNGLNKNNTNLYNEKIYLQIIEKLPEYNYILSNSLNIQNDNMIDIYKKCFIGLRLTENDGNANTVQEFKQVGIPIVHNLSEYGLKWNNIDDIILNIKYRHLDKFNNSIKDYKNILFICSDYPGYGGAATNCYRLINYYKKLGKNVHGLFYTKNKCLLNFDNHINIIDFKNFPNYIRQLKFKPDLIILRNYLPLEYLKLLEAPIFFCIPGLFIPSLDKNYKLIKTKKEMDKYINPNILINCRYAKNIFIASLHSKKILKKYYNIKCNILPFNYIPYYNTFTIKNNINRKYKYGIIVSNFERKIKNLDKIINKLKLIDDRVILIGKKSTKYLRYFQCYELIHPDQILDYYKDIEFIIQDSHYESVSNVIVEAYFNGCQVIKDI